ncbi:MAG: DUF3794 domain-containing protein [Clostridiales bacterium]|nr:DUF3794 domain-containing protein [Clostridiales bacterium]
MELINESINVTQTAASGKTQTLAEGDVIVPDIKPDILKLLQVDAVCSVTDKEVEDGAVSLCGVVDLKILYIPDNESDRIKSIITSFDFADRIENRKILPSSTAMVNSAVERVEFSMINSRKLRVKAVVGFEYEIVNTADMEVTVDIADCDEMEMEKETISVQNCVDLSEHMFTVSDNVEIPTGQGSVRELLKLDASISDTEYKAMSGKVIAKGEVNISALYNNTDGEIEYCEAQLPFTEIFEGALISEESCCDIDYAIREGEVTLEEDSDGDLRIINASMEVTAQLKASETVEMQMVSDCYRPFAKTTVEKQKIRLEEVISKPVMQNTVRETIETGAKLPRVLGVYNVITKPVVKKAQLEGGRLLCEGYIEACVLYLSDSAENPVYSIKKDIPFSYMMDAEMKENGDDNVQARVKAEIKHTGYNLNAAGEVEVRCILLLSANIVKSRDLELISAVESEEQPCGCGRGIVICFVQPGDTLWSIAKRYSVPKRAIMEFNDMQEESLKTGARLLIPGK